MNWEKCRTKYVSSSKYQRKYKVRATVKQKVLLRTLGVKHPRDLTKKQASALISRSLILHIRLENKTRKKIKLAMERDGE